MKRRNASGTPAGTAACILRRGLWLCDGYEAAHSQERVLPYGGFQLIIDLTDGFMRAGRSQRAAPPLVVGLRTQSTVVETAEASVSSIGAGH